MKQKFKNTLISLGEILVANTNFKSFADVTNEYIGSFAGFVTGWTYWLCWIITGIPVIIQQSQ